MEKIYTITVTSENKPGVLYRIAGTFVRRKINVESLNVFETKNKGISQFTITIFASEEKVKQIVKHIKKIVEVKSAKIL